MGTSWLATIKEEGSTLAERIPSRLSNNEENDDPTPSPVPPSHSERRVPRRARGGHSHSPPLTLRSAVFLMNRHCARLPSDTFTRLTPLTAVRQVGDAYYVCALQLPVNSCLREVVFGPPAPSETLAKRAAALEVLGRLRALKEVDDGGAGVAVVKEVVSVSKDSANEGDKAQQSDEFAKTGEAPQPTTRDTRTGTTKRRQYYYKQIARSLVASNSSSYRLYALNLRLTCAIPEDQNTRGRRIYPPEKAEQSFGCLVSGNIPKVSSMYCMYYTSTTYEPRTIQYIFSSLRPLNYTRHLYFMLFDTALLTFQICPFPIYTRSGEVLVTFVCLNEAVSLEDEKKAKILDFHQYTFAQVGSFTIFSPDSTRTNAL